MLLVPSFPNELQPERTEERAWERVERFIRGYSWFSVVAVGLGLAVAHKVLFNAGSWTTCAGNAWCVAAVHLHEVPFAVYIAGVGAVGLLGLTRASLHRFKALVGLSNIVQVAFAVFEAQVLIQSVRSEAPPVESVLLAIVVTGLLLGVAFGAMVQFRIDGYLNPPFDPRFEHPASEQELVALVKRAHAEGRRVRVRGAEHSVNASIYADEGLGAINVQLDRYNTVVRWDDARRRVTVQAGCHLGVDPRNPASNRRNSLVWQLDRRGWALPDLGGITHQTVGGFVSTGSMGGTTRYDFGESIVGIRLIDGTGKVHDLAPNPGVENDERTNPFYAAGVSMGLLGIISQVTLQCEARYDIEGQQRTSRSAQCAIPLFEHGALEKFFKETTYSRLLWWPQDGVDKVQVWQAERLTEPGGDAYEGGVLRRKPFVSLPGGAPVQALIKGFYDLVSHDRPPYEAATATLVRTVLNAVLSDGVTEFRDYWHTGLPMDNQISDTFLPTEFTELFIDISSTHAVMEKLREFYEDDAGMERTGPYACEVYPAKRSRFWLSPSYGRDSVRVDIFWFKTSQGTPELEFYPRYWKLLSGFDFRFHWGKYLANARSSTGARYIRSQYPMWKEFEAVRRQFDPAGTFLNEYWRSHLDL